MAPHRLHRSQWARENAARSRRKCASKELARSAPALSPGSVSFWPKGGAPHSPPQGERERDTGVRSLEHPAAATASASWGCSRLGRGGSWGVSERTEGGDQRAGAARRVPSPSSPPCARRETFLLAPRELRFGVEIARQRGGGGGFLHAPALAASVS